MIALAPNRRAKVLFKSIENSAIINVPVKIESLKVFKSDSLITFKNCIIALAKSDIKISSLKDLYHLRVAAFQNAAKILFPQYADVHRINPQYREFSYQKTQVYHLFHDRCDVAISDMRIFNYFVKNNLDKDFSNIKYSCVYKIGDSPRYIYFKDKKIRDAFNKELTELKRSSQYKKVLEKYNLYDAN